MFPPRQTPYDPLTTPDSGAASTSSTNTPTPTERHSQHPTLDETINTLIHCMSLNREDRHLCIEAALDQFRDDLHLASTVQPSNDTLSKCYTWLLTWLQISGNLLTRGTPLHATISSAMMSASQTPPEPPILQSSQSQPPSEEPLPDLSSPPPQHENSLPFRLFDTTAPTHIRKHLVMTAGDLLGMGPRWARKGDVVCVLYGCHVPVVLRRFGDMGVFEFVGECYVDGMMDGEGMLLGLEVREFVIV